VLVVVRLGEAITFLVPLVGPSLHHVMEFYDGLGMVVPEVAVEVPLGEAVLEAVDDVGAGDVGNGGGC
jgi:hypothetical protein